MYVLSLKKKALTPNSGEPWNNNNTKANTHFPNTPFLTSKTHAWLFYVAFLRKPSLKVRVL
jgi:hypothetical protein